MGNAFPPRAITGVIIFWVVAALVPTSLFAQDTESKRSLDFDDSLVEGMNRKPLDSVSHVGANNRGGRGHLYELREDFRSETRRLSELLKEAR